MSPPAPGPHRIGLISDTHGQLRSSVFDALSGVELILHAGDVGGREILDELRVIAPVHAVAGNTDPPGLYDPEFSVEIGGVRIHVSHGHELGAPTPKRLSAAYDAGVIVYGHTHQQLVTRLDDKLIVNPGAAGQRRFKLSPSVGILTITDGIAEVEIIDLA
jgi:putative phosphoesterase